jgi:hypothetical protein
VLLEPKQLWDARGLAVLCWMALAWMLATVLTGRPSSTSG